MLYAFVAMQAKVTGDVLSVRKLEAGDGELKSIDGYFQEILRENPAVSSVGTDALFCIIAFLSWSFLEGWF